MSPIFFQPYIGETFHQHQRILFLGESHYGDTSSETLTNDVVNNFKGGALDMAFFRRIGMLIDQEDIYGAWNKIAFANAIQVVLKTSTSQPSAENRKSINPAYYALLDRVQPGKVIVLSRRMWFNWLSEDNSEYVSNLAVGQKQSRVYRYTYSGGSCLVIGICHPSRMYGRNDLQHWKPLVDQFLTSY